MFLTFSLTLSNPSRIFFSMLLIFTASPVMVSFSAVVLASGTKIQSKMYKNTPVPAPNTSKIHIKRIQIASIPK